MLRFAAFTWKPAVVLVATALVLTARGIVPDPAAETTPYQVSGRVTTVSGDGLEAVVIELEGLGAATTDDAGWWSAAGLTGTVTVTPVMSGWNFTPAGIEVNGPADDVDFQAYVLLSGSPQVAEPTPEPIDLDVETVELPLQEPGGSAAPGPEVPSLRPTLDWQFDLAADYYNLVIWQEYPGGPEVHRATGLETTSYLLPEDLNDDMTYAWAVIAVSEDGQTMSQPYHFTVPPRRQWVQELRSYNLNSASAEYFPLAIGNCWYYVGGARECVHPPIAGEHGLVWFITHSTQRTSMQWRVGRAEGLDGYDDGYYRTGALADPFENGSLVVNFDGQVPGEEHPVLGNTCHYSTEKVTVAAGTFTAVRSVCRRNLEGWENHYWWVKGVGLVKTIALNF